jgi:uncharacterized protein with PIN domain
MCYMCDELDKREQARRLAGEDTEYDPTMESCQNCGAMICFDEKGGDDVIRQAYVTEGGDLYCDRCGRKYDRAEQEAEEAEGYWNDENLP